MYCGVTFVEKCVPRGGTSGRSELSCDPLEKENRYGYNSVHVHVNNTYSRTPKDMQLYIIHPNAKYD